jgi:glycosyltransferase involved in cell wall biosynthesis
VLNQTHKQVEVIVVDDGSTDDTARVAARYPITLLTQPRAGVCAAVNTGMRIARGELVMRLDADDILEATYIEETLVPLRQSGDIHFVYTTVEYFGAKRGSYPVEDFHADSLAERNYVHASALMRRASFERVGGYDSSMATARCEDWDLWLAFAEHGLAGALVPKPLLRYRQHPVSSRNTLTWRSWTTLRRNLSMATRLQVNHPRLFAPERLLRRISRLPTRVRRGDASPRFALLLTALYGFMLMRSLSRFTRLWSLA